MWSRTTSLSPLMPRGDGWGQRSLMYFAGSSNQRLPNTMYVSTLLSELLVLPSCGLAYVCHILQLSQPRVYVRVPCRRIVRGGWAVKHVSVQHGVLFTSKTMNSGGSLMYLIASFLIHFSRRRLSKLVK